MYQYWSEECGIQFKKFKAEDDLAGIEKWVIKIKYTAKRIKNEYTKIKNDDNP